MCPCVSFLLRKILLYSIYYLSLLILWNIEIWNTPALGGKLIKKNSFIKYSLTEILYLLIKCKIACTRISIRRYAYTHIYARMCLWKSIAMRHRRRQTVRNEPVGTKCPGMSSNGRGEGGRGWSDIGRPDRGFILYFMADSPCAPSVTSAV